jgi:hypothetical protein
LAEHLKVIRDQADAVADDVAERFGDSAWQVRSLADTSRMGLRGTVASEQSGLAAAASARRSKVELLMGVARGGSVAVVASHAIGIVFAVALPITIPIAAVVAGVLGRMTLRSARSAQMRQLRAEAERTVAVYLDEVEVRARHDSRDTVRRVQQHLREVFTDHATELHNFTTRNLEVLAKSVQAELKTDRDSVARSTVELKRLQALAAQAAALVEQLLGAIRTAACLARRRDRGLRRYSRAGLPSGHGAPAGRAAAGGDSRPGQGRKVHAAERAGRRTARCDRRR